MQIDWIISNREWVFSGFGVIIGLAVFSAIWRVLSKNNQSAMSGDHIEAEIGEDSQHVTVGKNIYQIGALQIPKSVALAVLTGVVIMAGATVIIAIYSAGILEAVSNSMPTPTTSSSPASTVEQKTSVFSTTVSSSSKPTATSPLLSTLTPLSPSIKDVVIGTMTDDHYKTKVTLYNPADEKLLATQLAVALDFGEGACGPGLTFVLSDKITVSAVEKGGLELATDFRLDSNSDELSGYEFPVEGTFWHPSNECATLHLILDTSFMIPPNDYTSFYIHIPQKFRIVEASDAGVPYQRFPPFVDVPSLTKSDIEIWIHTDKTDPIFYTAKHK